MNNKPNLEHLKFFIFFLMLTVGLFAVTWLVGAEAVRRRNWGLIGVSWACEGVTWLSLTITAILSWLPVRQNWKWAICAFGITLIWISVSVIAILKIWG